MRIRDYLVLLVWGWLVSGMAAMAFPESASMDADYALAVGQRIASGQGLTENFVWNYLSNDFDLPRPSNAYWMPLASLIAGFGIGLTGTFLDIVAAGRLPFVFLAGLVAPVIAWLSWRIYRDTAYAWLSGLVAGAQGFYLVQVTQADVFGVNMLAGVGYLAILHRWSADREGIDWLGCIGIGVLSGVVHAGRSEGLVWLGLAGLAALSVSISTKKGWAARLRHWIVSGSLIVAGYLLVMGGWLLRNWIVLGTPISTGGSQALFLTRYEDLFLYPGSALNLQHWLASGIPAILATRGEAIFSALLNTLAINGMIFLLPFMLIGIWKERRSFWMRWGLAGWLLVAVIMSVVFPFVGQRGGFFHAVSFLQPLFWVIFPVGLDRCLRFMAEKRRWRTAENWRVFGVAVVVLAVLVGVGVLARSGQARDSLHATYTAVDGVLENDFGTQYTVMVANPPAYSLASGQNAYVIPYGDVETILRAARELKVDVIVMTNGYLNTPSSELIRRPGDREGIRYDGRIDDAYIYRVVAGAK